MKLLRKTCKAAQTFTFYSGNNQWQGETWTPAITSLCWGDDVAYKPLKLLARTGSEEKPSHVKSMYIYQRSVRMAVSGLIGSSKRRERERLSADSSVSRSTAFQPLETAYKVQIEDLEHRMPTSRNGWIEYSNLHEIFLNPCDWGLQHSSFDVLTARQSP